MSNDASHANPVHIRSAVRTLPAYVPGARADDSGIVKLSSNEMPFPPHPDVVAAIHRACHEANRYPQMHGEDLIAQLAERHGVDRGQLVVGNGSVALIQHLLSTVCDEGDEVVIPWRSFEAYPICIAVAGARAVKVPLTPAGCHDIPAMIEAVTPRTRALFICSPNNPTGTVLSREELLALLDAVPQRVLVMVDEAYLDFVTDPQVGNALEFIDRYPNLVVSRTFSKAYTLAGMRVGYMVGDAGLISALGRVCTPFGVSLPSLAAAQACLAQPVREVMRQRVATIQSERERVVTALRAQGWTVASTQANFYWLEVGEQALDLATHFAAAGVLVRPFAGEGVRITVGLPGDNERVLDAASTWTGRRG